MREEKTTTQEKSNIQCVEVLISRDATARGGHNLYWTLSVYSLQNSPAKKSRQLNNCEVFHFMVYDWNRTIQQLLEDHKVPYFVIQFFGTKNISDSGVAGAALAEDDERRLLSAISNLSDTHSRSAAPAARLERQHIADLVFEHEP